MSNVVMFPRPVSSPRSSAAASSQQRPCQDCPNYSRCADGKACLAFAVAHLSNGNHPWRQLPREPSKDIYKRLFPAPLPF